MGGWSVVPIVEKGRVGVLGGPTNSIGALCAVLVIQLWLSGRSCLYSVGFLSSRTDSAWALWAVVLIRLGLSGRPIGTAWVLWGGPIVGSA